MTHKKTANVSHPNEQYAKKRKHPGMASEPQHPSDLTRPCAATQLSPRQSHRGHRNTTPMTERLPWVDHTSLYRLYSPGEQMNPSWTPPPEQRRPLAFDCSSRAGSIPLRSRVESRPTNPSPSHQSATPIAGSLIPPRLRRRTSHQPPLEASGTRLEHRCRSDC